MIIEKYVYRSRLRRKHIHIGIYAGESCEITRVFQFEGDTYKFHIQDGLSDYLTDVQRYMQIYARMKAD